jgi:hypothetical protein
MISRHLSEKEILKDANTSTGKQTRTRLSKQQNSKAKIEEKRCELSKDEQALCDRFGISQKQYILIRESIIIEAAKQGYLQREALSGMFRMDKSIVYAVVDLLKKKHYIS